MPLWLRSTFNTLLLPGSVAGLVPYLIARGSWRLPLPLEPLRWLSVVPFGLGLLLLLLTIWDFGASGRGTLAPWDAPRELVHQRLYQWVRNPMYLGVLACILGQALLWESGGDLIYLVVIALVFHLRVVRFEEPALARQFGDQYRRYIRIVPRWLPRRPRPPAET